MFGFILKVLFQDYSFVLKSSNLKEIVQIIFHCKEKSCMMIIQKYSTEKNSMGLEK